jgi:hypothetical protein
MDAGLLLRRAVAGARCGIRVNHIFIFKDVGFDGVELAAALPARGDDIGSRERTLAGREFSNPLKNSR